MDPVGSQRSRLLEGGRPWGSPWGECSDKGSQRKDLGEAHPNPSFPFAFQSLTLSLSSVKCSANTLAKAHELCFSADAAPRVPPTWKFKNQDVCLSSYFLFPSDDRVTWTQQPRDIPTGWASPKREVLRPQGAGSKEQGLQRGWWALFCSWGPPTHTVRDKSLRGKRAVPSVLHSADSSTLGSELRKTSQDSRTRGRSGHRMRAKTRTRGGQSLGWPCFVPLRPDGEVGAPWPGPQRELPQAGGSW